MISPGTRLGNYEVIAPLGAGGMGAVYRARDLRLDRAVAVKILPGDFAADPNRVRRFEAEARAASELYHPHIVSIFGTGQTDSISYISQWSWSMACPSTSGFGNRSRGSRGCWL